MTVSVYARIVRFAAAGYCAVSQPETTFQLQAGSVRNSGHGGRRANGRRYRSGDTVRQSGIYEVIHDRDHREAHEVVMISGERFPGCETCRDRVRFRLVRTAPYIFQDEDFEEET
ncbi:MAG TPA: hypothetical protein VL240_03095 [Candidatus Binatia bacterium]|nr:hypothetical protein [Candidatus Binatia bacterium]